jgi:DNA-binding CsgD family transcriptional regulator
VLVGRDTEIDCLRRLLVGAQQRRSSALVLDGEPGVGKTALLLRAAELASEFRVSVLRCRGVEIEASLPFAGLFELLSPIAQLRERIPTHQARAVAGALALEPASGSDRFAVAVGVLSLLAAAAEDSPLLALVDDAHLLDEPSAEALLFAGRRLGAEGIVMLFAVRDEPAGGLATPALKRLHLKGLRDEEACAVLRASAPGRVDDAVAIRLVRAVRGNPLALRELPGVVPEPQLRGHEPLDEPLRPGAMVEAAFRRQLEALPLQTRRGLTVAAAAENPREVTIGAALLHLGMDMAVLDAAERLELIHRTPSELAFGHPICRAVAYHAASPEDRRAAHAALAAVSGPASGARRAWHEAAAAIGPDEQVARTLEEVGGDARERGAFASAAQALARAAQLTPEPGRRARRLVEAAADLTLTGQPIRALGLIDEAVPLTTDASVRADSAAVRGEVMLRRGQWEEGHELLVTEAERIAASDPARAAALTLLACSAHMATGRMARFRATAERARILATASDPVGAIVAEVLLAEALLPLGRRAEGEAILAKHEHALVAAADGVITTAIVQVVGMAAACSMWIEKWPRSQRILARLVAGARSRATVAALPYPLAIQAQLAFRQGRWNSGYAEATEATHLAEETGQLGLLAFTLAVLAEIEAPTGRERSCREHAGRALELAEPVGALAICNYAWNALGLLELSLGRIDEAITASEHCRAIAREVELREPSAVQWAPNLLEAYVSASRDDDAHTLLAELTDDAERTGGNWALGCAARGRGLIAADEAGCRNNFDEAVQRHVPADLPFDAARNQLALGERLRRLRAGRRARPPLRQALQAFERLGAEPWARRARRELRATGLTTPARRRKVAGELTAHELNVGLLVADGMSNREVAAALFVSPKTIEFHLGQIYRKLNIRSRTQLGRALAVSSQRPS